MLASKMAPEAGHPEDGLAQARRRGRGGAPLDDKISRPPFPWVEDHFAVQVGTNAPEHQGEQNPPGDDHVQSEAGQQPLLGFQAQLLDLASAFQYVEVDFDAPTHAIPGHHRRGLLKAGGRQQPLQRLHTRRRRFLARQHAVDGHRREPGADRLTNRVPGNCRPRSCPAPAGPPGSLSSARPSPPGEGPGHSRRSPSGCRKTGKPPTVSDHPPHAAGMLSCGCRPNCSSTASSRRFNLSSPRSALPTSSSAQPPIVVLPTMPM